MFRAEAWFTEGALIEVNKFLASRQNLRVFEFGMGYSTLWLDKMDNIDLLVSVEHDQIWYEQISEKVKKRTYTIFEQRPYNQIISNYTDNFFDCIIIDGRDRVKCLQSSINKLKDDGILILDNSERLEYIDGIELYKNWLRFDFEQEKPDKYGFTYPNWTTTIFKKTKLNFMEMMLNNQQEVDFLLDFLKPTHSVLEWGSGGSTIEIAKRVKSVVSIEHDKNWYDKVNQVLPKNAELYHIPRNQEEKPGHDGTLDDYLDYVNFPTSLGKKFDVIFIDGRARVECAKICLPLLKKTSTIFIHDYCHPQDIYRRFEYEIVEQFLNKVGQEFAMAKFKVK